MEKAFILNKNDHSVLKLLDEYKIGIHSPYLNKISVRGTSMATLSIY